MVSIMRTAGTFLVGRALGRMLTRRSRSTERADVAENTALALASPQSGASTQAPTRHVVSPWGGLIAVDTVKRR